jgi:mycothiol S-conjugate amidase
MMQIHAHPDDEASKGAGTTAKYVSEGVRCVLVTATGGEAGDILNSAEDRHEVRADLAAVRLRELNRSVEILGYHALHLLGYRDSGMPESEPNKHPENLWNANFDQVLDALVDIVRREKPQVILGYDDDHSGYPHPDHIRAQELAFAVMDAAADPNRGTEEPWQVSKLYAMGWTRRRAEKVHNAMVAAGKDASFLSERLEKWDPAKDAAYTSRVWVGDHLKFRSEALRAHATQVAPDSFFFAIDDDTMRELYPWEDYRLVRSSVQIERDSEGFELDLFSGLR